MRSTILNRYTKVLMLLLGLSLMSCVTTRKKKDEVGWIGKKWHDMNARYNGFFNAKELYKVSSLQIVEGHEDNYAQVLDIYQYGEPESRESVAKDMDIAIEKVTKVAALHEPSKWVDDCYVMMGKAQYLKGDLETAQETFEYFVDDFNPTDPDSRVYVSPNKKEAAKERKKERDNERKIKQDERKEEQKEKEQTRKEKEKERKKAAKQREKDRKQRAKDRKKGKKTTRTPQTTTPENSPVAEPTVVASENNDIPIDEDEAYIRDLELKNAKKEEKVKPQGGFLKHRPAYYEGMLWLTKTFIARERWIEANYFLDKLESDPAVPKDILAEVPIVRADYFLQMKDYNNAIPALNHALETAKDGKLKARMAFIQAQVYQIKGESAMANQAFESVKKYKANFEMSLQARINQIKTGWSAGKDSSDKAVRQLNRLGKEDKYETYRGHIYSAAAEILLASGNKEEALVYFKKALEGDNSSTLRTEVYFRLATLFYGNQEYLSAKNYYDSTLSIMPEKDERYSLTKRYSKNLKGIAMNLEAITLHDSLLILGQKSEGELRKLAEAQVKKDWEDKLGAADAEEESGGFTASTTVLSVDSKFFAYNPTLKSKGRQDFLRKWGNRSLQDNWRLSSKLQGITDEVEAEVAEVTIPDGELQSEVNRIIREIPTTEEDRAKSNDIIEQALFELGTGFRTNLEKYEESTEALEELLLRFPNTEHKPEAYFFLHLNAIDLANGSKATEYKDRLIKEFPQSDFAAYLKNPDGDDLMTAERRIEQDYEKAYTLFDNGEYQAAFEYLVEKSTRHGEEHKLAAKYELLKAMCVGNLKGQEEYINALRSVILRFNNTPEQAHAREMIRFLRGDEDTFTSADGEDVDSKFVIENDKVHYMLIVLFDELSGTEMNEAKKLVNEYNEANFKAKRLRSTSLALNKETKSQLILVRRYTGKDDAMTYYQSVIEAGSDFLSTDDYSYEVFAINQKNYRQVMRDKTVNQYRSFFDKQYFGTE